MKLRAPAVPLITVDPLSLIHILFEQGSIRLCKSAADYLPDTEVPHLDLDGALVLEMFDPHPITQHGKVGLGTYASQIQVRNFRVRQIVSRAFTQSYTCLLYTSRCV